jgi:hypothetical protein
MENAMPHTQIEAEQFKHVRDECLAAFNIARAEVMERYQSSPDQIPGWVLAAAADAAMGLTAAMLCTLWGLPADRDHSPNLAMKIAETATIFRNVQQRRN